MPDYWIEVAPQLTATIINDLCIFNSKLYGATNSGELYEWNDVDAWTSVAPQYGSATNILKLVSYDDNLYGLTNLGTLQEWNQVDAWLHIVDPPVGFGDANTMIVFGSGIYATMQSENKYGRLFYWGGSGSTWTLKVSAGYFSNMIFCLTEYQDTLYGGSSWYGDLNYFNGVSNWVNVASLGYYHDTRNIIVYSGKIYCDGQDTVSHKLYRYDGISAFEQVAPVYYDNQTIGELVEFGGKMYAVMVHYMYSEGGQLLEWNGVDAWTEAAPKLSENDLYCCIVYNNRLFAGTGQNGKLYMWSGISGPVQSQLMRHGKYFSGGIEQPFWWAK